MLKTMLITSAALLVGATAGAQQQAPAPVSPGAAATVRPTVTLTGCLYREAQVPGRSPNPAERAGILEDYIIAGATGGGGTPATGSMYKVENIPDDKLKALVGKRIEVTGRVDPEGRDLRRPTGTAGGATPDRGIGPDAISLPEIEAASIREVSGTCPATPAAPR